MNGGDDQQPGPSNALPWSQPALSDVLAALQMQMARTASENSRMFPIGQPSPMLPTAAAMAAAAASSSPLASPLQSSPSPLNAALTAAATAAAAAALANPAPFPFIPPNNPLLHSYQQLLNPAFLELQRQLIAQQAAQFRFPLLPGQMTPSLTLPSMHQVPPQPLPHVAPLSSTASAAPPLPARPVPRKPAPVVVPSTTTISTSTATSSRINGTVQFAVPKVPTVRKASRSCSRPSTSDDKGKLPVNLKQPAFEMGKLPTKNYIPSHFMKGTLIQMANGRLKKVEDLSSDDFLLSAPLSREFNVDASIVVEIAKASTLARVTFAVGQSKYKAVLEPQLEYPFFVLGKGWCSCDPRRSLETYGLDCQELKVGDVCISLTRRSEDCAKQLDEAVTLAEASELKVKEAAQAAAREELSKKMEQSDGRTSAPPCRYHPYLNIRKMSES